MIFASQFPLDGRVGLAHAGEHAGCFLLVTNAGEAGWIVYTAPSSDEFRAWTSDFRLGREDLEGRLRDWQLEWLSPEEDVIIEREHFGLREHWRQLRKGHN